MDTGLGSTSGAGVGSASSVAPVSPIKTVPEPVSITSVPAALTSKCEPPPASPVSAVSPLRAAF